MAPVYLMYQVANRQGVSSQAAVDLRIADLEKRIQDMQVFCRTV
jgi:hypothetical protein